jgi:hypothetical protein
MTVMRSIANPDPSLPQERHQLQPRFRIPQDLPVSISRHVIPVTEPEDIFRNFQSRRERNYHLLIRRFINQILYGCTNPACATPTCLSYQKRTTKTPLRKLTPLSARTLACYLASESNPEASLCPHCPQVFPEHDPSPVGRKRPRRKSHNVTFESSEKGADNSSVGKLTENGHLQSPDITRSRPGVLVKSTSDASRLEDCRVHMLNQHLDEQREQASNKQPSEERPARDPKSFTQSLFETLPLRMLDWLPFQSRREFGISYQSSSYPPSHDDEYPTTKTSENLLGTTKRRSNQNSPFPVSQTRSGRMRSDPSAELSDENLATLPNVTARHSHKEIVRPERVIRSSSLKTEDRRLTDHTTMLPASMSFPDKRRSSYQTASCPPLSVELGQDTGTDTTASNESSTKNNCSHDLELSQHADQQSNTDDQPLSEPGLVFDRNAVAATCTLDRIPRQTFTELRLMQARLEKQCLGYQLTDPRPWPDPKPQEHLALRFSDWSAFIQQCCFYLLKDPCRLAQAFEWDARFEDIIGDTAWPTSILPFPGFAIFGALYRLRPSEEILQFISYSLDQVFLSTLELMRPLRSQTNRDRSRRYSQLCKQSVDRNATGLSNQQAAFICAVTLYALGRLAAIKHQCSVSGHADLCWRLFCRVRRFGLIMPADFIAVLDKEFKSDCHYAHLKCLTDVFENDGALDLVSKLAKAISNRVTFSEVSNTRVKQEMSKKRQSVLQLLMQYLKDFSNRDLWPSQHQRPVLLSSTTLEWLRTIVLRDWDGQPIVRRAGAVGGALQMLAAMYEDRSNLCLEERTFQTPFFAQRLDTMEMPVEWLSYRPDNKTFHLLSFSFLFPPSTLVIYFRALNFATMSKSFETALITSRHVSQFGYSGFIHVANDVQLLSTMRPAMATYLVLNVRRDNVVTDAMNQLWRRQKRELMRPLKVRMGMDEGEEGIDHGGVQQEFFRCLFAEALDPAYGMFTIDERTRMTWFQPCSLEPLYKFEMLGVLFSIAVYNSITLPVTFPTAFYRKLLDLHVKKLNHIQDGWPDLAKGLQEMLDWSDGDVGDIFMRTYEFSFDAFGRHIDVDMQNVARDDPWPSPSPSNTSFPRTTPEVLTPISETTMAENDTMLGSGKPRISDGSPTASTFSKTSSEASLVTNTNRKQYVKDYIFWLAHKSIHPQYEAFARGFYTCLDRTALSIFTAEALKSVIEGSQHIDIAKLESITKYEDGFSADTPTIRHFWDVVKGFPDEKKRGLLEFVTASERVPVNGLGSIVFVIQRSGFDDRRLPTSMTCFGRLLLPQYSSREVLEEKLGKAIENKQGFGVA